MMAVKRTDILNPFLVGSVSSDLRVGVYTVLRFLLYMCV